MLRTSLSLATTMLFVALLLPKEVVAQGSGPEKPGTDAAVRKPVKVGEVAPQLSITVWTDGKERSLKDYRGKSVVLHFWGNWCGSCIPKVPMWNALEKKYADKGVVFIGIHSAGVKVEEAKGFMKKHGLLHVTGIDNGMGRIESETWKRFGVRVADTMIVVSKTGRIVFNGYEPLPFKGKSEGTLPMIAKSLGLKLPGPGVSQEEGNRVMLKIVTEVHSRIIEAALANNN